MKELELKYDSVKSIFYVGEMKGKNYIRYEISQNFAIKKHLQNKKVRVYFDQQGQNIVKVLASTGEVFTNKGREEVLNQTSFTSSYPEDVARAPYNFIPLSSQTIEYESLSPNFAEYSSSDSLSGYIDFEINAISDIFIRGELEKFFEVGGIDCIPGSSLRGLVRSTASLIAGTPIEFVDKEKRFFYRNISDNFYKNKVVANNNGITRTLTKGGWLKRFGNQIRLLPIDKTYKISMNKLNTSLRDTGNSYSFRDVWFDEATVQPLKIKNINGKEFKLQYNMVTKFETSEKMGYRKGTLVLTGLFGNKKHYQWIIPTVESFESDNGYDVTDLMLIYEKDETRDDSANLLRELRGNRMIPCFYLPGADGNPKYIGHTGVFRLPYDKIMANAIPDLRSDNDIISQIFGHQKEEESTAGRVYFEDSFAKGEIRKEFAALKILASPKPTSFQHYLEQTGNTANSHWGTDAKIRGTKMYWHRLGANWRNETEDIRSTNKNELINKCLIEKNSQFTIGEVILKGSKFSGRIRFENLHKTELGLLLLAIDLPEGCAHKIGMGKPIGLGSVRITPKLTITNRHERYDNIFDTIGYWHVGNSVDSQLEQYKVFFVQKFKKSGINSYNSSKEYWDQNQRMLQLKAMLTLNPIADSRSWEDYTRYMEIERGKDETEGIKGINEYGNRPVLPVPIEVIGFSKKKK